MVDSRVVKQEKSMAVSGRVDIVYLAEVYGGLTKLGFKPDTLSSLVSYCVDVAHSALEQNGHIEKRFDGVLEAYEVLRGLGIMTKSMHKLNARKVSLAAGFENLRKEGVDPECYAPGYYKTLHNSNSVKPSEYERHKEVSDDELVRIALETARKIDEAKVYNAKRLAELKARADEDGIIRSLPAIEPGDGNKEPTFEQRKNMSQEQLQAWRLKEQKKRVEENRKKRENSDIPRPKTEAEIEEDRIRLKQKDNDLMKALDAPSPKPTIDN